MTRLDFQNMLRGFATGIFLILVGIMIGIGIAPSLMRPQGMSSMMGLSGGGWDKLEPTEPPSPLSGIYTGTAPAEAARPIESGWCLGGTCYCTVKADGSLHCTPALQQSEDALRIETPRGLIPNSAPDWQPSHEGSHFSPDQPW